jgi:hypothetical protein
MAIFFAVFFAIIAAGIVLQPAVLRVIGTGMMVIIGLVFVIYLANVAPAALFFLLTSLAVAVALGLVSGLIDRADHAAASKLRTPHTYTKLGYGGADAAVYQAPSRTYHRLGH